MPGSEVLRHDSAAKCSPPAPRNCSRPRIASSSSVSRQSAEKPGAAIASRFVPALASASRTASVAGSSHFARPKRLWNVVSIRRFVRSSAALEQARGLAAMAVIGIAELERALRHPVEAQQQHLRREVQSFELLVEIGSERVDIGGIVVVWRQGPQRGLPTHRPQLVRSLVHNRRGRRAAVLRVQRREQDAIAPRLHQRLHLVAYRGAAIAHRVAHDHAIP